MATWLLKQLETFGVQAEAIPLGKQAINGEPSDLELPPVILGRIGTDPEKPTVLVYGHFDVQPVSSVNMFMLRMLKLDLDRLRRATAGRRNHLNSMLTLRMDE